MANFFTESEHLTLENKIECLDGVIAKLCDRFDGFEAILLDIKSLLEEKKAVHSVDASPPLHIDPTTKVDNNGIVTIGFCGQPEGPGFDNASITEEKGIRSLYEIRKTDATHAYFFPLEDKLSRFRNNATPLLLPVCTINGDITDCSTFIVKDDEYGLLVLEDGNYWKVYKKCIINCVNIE